MISICTSAEFTLQIEGVGRTEYNIILIQEVGGGGSGGHTIKDSAGVTLPTQPVLKFGAGFIVEDETGETVVSSDVLSTITTEQPVEALKFDADYWPDETRQLDLSTGSKTLSLNTGVTNIVGKSNFFDVIADGVNSINLGTGFKLNGIFPSDLNGMVLAQKTYLFRSKYSPNGIVLEVPALYGSGTIIPRLIAPVLSTGTPTASIIPLLFTDPNTSSNERSLEIQYSDDGVTDWTTEATLVTDATTYNAIVPSSTLRYFRIRAIGNGVNEESSLWSNVVSGTTASEQSFFVITYKTGSNTDDEAITDCLAAASIYPAREITFSDKTWNISEPILLPSNTTVIIDNCKIKQNDLMFDNVFRGNNYTFANELLPTSVANDIPSSVTALENIKILGLGAASIEGPDVNATGIHAPTGLSQTIVGDFWGWRTYQILLSLCTGFEIGGISFTKSRGWTVVSDDSSFGNIHDLDFTTAVKNGDGIDLRSGSHDIVISNITGDTSDDLVACSSLITAGISNTYPDGNYQTLWEPSGIYSSSKSVGDYDIYNINILNVHGIGANNLVRLLAVNGNMLHDVEIVNISDLNVSSTKTNVLKISGGYGVNTPGKPIYNINASNITSYNADVAVWIGDYVMQNMAIDNAIQLNAGKTLFSFYSYDGITILNSIYPKTNVNYVDSIVLNNIVAYCNIFGLYGTAVSDYGIVFGDNPSPTLADNVISKGGSVGDISYSSIIPGLTAGNTYYIRAFAVNSFGTQYSIDYSFIAASEPVHPLVFDGVNDKVIASNVTGLNDFTIEFEYLTSLAKRAMYLCQRDVSGDDEWQIYYENGVFSFYLWTTTGQTILPIPFLGSGVWDNLQIVVDDVNKTIVVNRDGVAVSQTTYTGNLVSYNSNLTIGASGFTNTTVFFNGKVRKLKITSGLSTIYDADFTEGAGVILPDSSVNANDGTISGATWQVI